MVLQILFCVCLVVEAVFTPWYLKALWPTKCFKSLCLKMVCSAMFFSIGILSMLIARNTSEYAVTMLVGLGLGWIGDYFLHAKPSNAYFATGFTSFMFGHVVYIIAYMRALPRLVPGYNQLDLRELLPGLAVLLAAVVGAAAIHMKFNPKPVKWAVLLYAAILTLMTVKAISLGVHVYLSGAENGVWAAIVLSAGSFFFMLSDASLAVILFGGQKKNYPLKIFNIVTYFWGQVMLAASILFVAA